MTDAINSSNSCERCSLVTEVLFELFFLKVYKAKYER